LAAQTFVENRKRQSDQQTPARDGTIEQTAATLKKSASDGSVEGKSTATQAGGEKPSVGSAVENANGKKSTDRSAAP
jgi:hypothetical protein